MTNSKADTSCDILVLKLRYIFKRSVVGKEEVGMYGSSLCGFLAAASPFSFHLVLDPVITRIHLAACFVFVFLH